MRAFFLAGAVGLILSLVAHLSTFFGVNPHQKVRAVWLLHIGIFVVFIPTLIVTNRMMRGYPRREFWRRVSRSAPSWMRRLTGLFFAYAFFNFVFSLFYLNEGGVPGKIDGALVLHNHGKVIRKLTPHEFQRHEAYVVRGFSGHWMFFYSASMTILYAWIAEQRLATTAEEQLHHT